MDSLNKREFLKTTVVLGAAAILAAENTSAQEPNAGETDLGDDQFRSDSGWHFGSQAIHHGEQPGFQVTPISQDKCAPGYQRPGNLSNPTVASLLRKVMKLDGTEAAVVGPSGMSMISQTYLPLLKPGDRVVAHRCNYDCAVRSFRTARSWPASLSCPPLSTFRKPQLGCATGNKSVSTDRLASSRFSLARDAAAAR